METSPTLPKLSNYKKIPPGHRSRYVRRRFTDLRSREGKELAAVVRQIEDDLGPLSAGQKVLVESLRFKLATLRAIASWVERQESVIREDGLLLPILSRNAISFSNSLRLDVFALYGLKEDKRGKVPDLEAYLRSKTVEVPEVKP
jgi:hypothetical protein